MALLVLFAAAPGLVPITGGIDILRRPLTALVCVSCA